MATRDELRSYAKFTAVCATCGQKANSTPRTSGWIEVWMQRHEKEHREKESNI